MAYKFGIPPSPTGEVTDVGGTQSTDASTGVVFPVTLNTTGTNALENPTNLQEGQKYTWQLKQDAVTPVDVTFGTDFLFAGGTAPTITQNPGAVDIVHATALDSGSGVKLYSKFEADVSQPSTGPVAPDNMNHWWKLNTGSSTATDEGTTAVTRYDLPLTNVSTGSNGNRTSSEDVNIFNGTSAYGRSNAGIQVSTGLCVVSFSFWVKLTAAYTTNEFLFMLNSNGGWSNGLGCYFDTSDSTIRFYTGNSYSTQYSKIAAPSVDVWTHIACTYDFNATSRIIYKDGTPGTNLNDPPTFADLYGSGCGGATQPAGNYYFGIGSAMYGAGGVAGYYTQCELSDFRVYDINLTPSQVSTIAAGDWP